MDDQEKIQAGDVVRLRSDSREFLKMTVEEVGNDIATCFYINPDTKAIEKKDLPVIVLLRYI